MCAVRLIVHKDQKLDYLCPLSCVDHQKLDIAKTCFFLGSSFVCTQCWKILIEN